MADSITSKRGPEGETFVGAVELEIIYSALLASAKEMSEALGRSAYSPIIREMLDYSCGIFDADGDLVAQAENIPAHLGSMGFALRHTLEVFPLEQMAPGDAFITNDPYQGGTHTPDLHVFTPAFRDGVRIGICGTIAHHVDMGGKNPGTEGYDNRSIFEEGLRITPVRLATAGVIEETVLRLIAANVREPVTTMGDLRAQIASCRYGERRLVELAERYGSDRLLWAMRESMDYSERRMRSEVAGMADATNVSSGWLDNDGVGDEPVEIQVRVTVSGDEIEVDFAGTQEQMLGGMNVPPAAASSAVLYAVKCIVDPETPQNQGCFRSISIKLPEGTVVNPDFPAAVSLRHLAVQRIGDTVLRALTELYPDRGAAGSFVGFSSIAVEGINPNTGEVTVCQDDLGGGMGAHASGDGLDGVDTHLGNVGILPAEVCEMTYPIRVLTTELIADSGGAGKYRGGLGIRRDYQFLTSGQTGIAYTEQSRPDFASWGLAGGGIATPASITRTEGEVVERIRKGAFETEPGMILAIETGGGGGFGIAAERNVEDVSRDLEEGKIGIESAETTYAVVVRNGVVDAAASAALREGE